MARPDQDSRSASIVPLGPHPCAALRGSQVLYSLVSHHCTHRGYLAALSWLAAESWPRPGDGGGDALIVAAHLLLQARRGAGSRGPQAGTSRL